MSQRDPLERAIEAYRSRCHEFEIFLIASLNCSKSTPN
jgi:hypothetical protein